MIGTAQCKELHGAPIYSVAFNQIDPALQSVFATVGAQYATVYRVLVDAQEEESMLEGSKEKTAQPSRAKKATKQKRKQGRPTILARMAVQIQVVQIYRDEDDDESFYCVDWPENMGAHHLAMQKANSCLAFIH